MRLQVPVAVNTKSPENNFKNIDIILKQLFTIVNGNIDFGNMGGKILTATRTSGDASTDVAVVHNLGRVPNYYVVLRSKGAAVSDGATAWDANNIYVRLSTQDSQVTLLII